jgi:hypothetical protein
MTSQLTAELEKQIQLPEDVKAAIRVKLVKIFLLHIFLAK